MKADERGDADGFLTGSCTEESSIKKAIAGDKNAYEQLMVPYLKSLYNFIRFRAQNDDDCNDILQETMLAIWQSLKSFNFNSSFKTWVFGIANNKINDFFRKNYRFSQKNIDDYYDISDPDDAINKMIIQNDVRNAVSKLKEDDKQLIYLLFYVQLKYHEVSEIMKIPVGTIKSRMSTIKQKLKINLGEGYYDKL